MASIHRDYINALLEDVISAILKQQDEPSFVRVS